MASDHDETRPYAAFRSYADEERWEAEAADDEPGPLAAGWSDTPAWRRAEPPPEPRSWRGPLIASGATVALIAAGVGWAVLRDPAEPAMPAPPPVAASSSKPLEVVMVAPPPPTIPTVTERMEVLPQGRVTPARPSAAQAVIPIAPAPPQVTARAEPPSPPLEAPSVIPAAREASVRTAAEPRRFDACREAPTRAYEMVCSDRRLAEADRRMKRAYSAALAAGVPPDELLRDQEDWLDVREDAARISPRAVADIYRQRTRELFALADRPWD